MLAKKMTIEWAYPLRRITLLIKLTSEGKIHVIKLQKQADQLFQVTK